MNASSLQRIDRPGRAPLSTERVEAEVRAHAGASRPRGMTLIEVAVALVILVLLMSAVVTGIGAITGAKAKAAAGELGGVIRSLYDTASLSGRTCRLVFRLPPENDEVPVEYWAECAEKGVTTSRDRDDALEQEARRLEDEARLGATAKSGQQTLRDALAGEQQRVENEAKFSAYTSEEIEPRKLPSGVQVSVWTRHQREAVSSGPAYLYFFPQGFTERAMVFVHQGDDTWTITVSPLTGKTKVVSEALEVPQA